ncbi:hypothetical protein NKH77_02315 [Streptomyces sp. M19]
MRNMLAGEERAAYEAHAPGQAAVAARPDRRQRRGAAAAVGRRERRDLPAELRVANDPPGARTSRARTAVPSRTCTSPSRTGARPPSPSPGQAPAASTSRR